MVVKAGIIFLLSCLSSFCLYAEGIKVSPGAFCAQSIDIGKDIDLGVSLIIHNDGDESKVFSITSLKPSQAKND